MHLSTESICLPEEVEELWNEIQGDTLSETEIDRRTCRLAVSMIRDEKVKKRIEEIDKSHDRQPQAGFIYRLSQLAQRVRITPLEVIAESDPDAAHFLMQYPHIIEYLIDEQGEVLNIGQLGDQTRLTEWLRAGVHDFIRAFRGAAPYLLERAGIGRNHTEDFLHYLALPEPASMLEQAERVGDVLCALLVEFAIENKLLPEEMANPFRTPARWEALLWRVVFDLSRVEHSGEVHQRTETSAVSPEDDSVITQTLLRLENAMATYQQNGIRGGSEPSTIVDRELEPLQSTHPRVFQNIRDILHHRFQALST